jgi:sulfite reductase alpha subunit
MDIQSIVIDNCPTQCMTYSAKDGLEIDNGNCTRCMFCLARITKALRPGEEKGATILIGSKAPFEVGATLSWVIVPFMPMEPPYDEFKKFVEKTQEWWDEHGKNRERIGELILRRGMRDYLQALDLEPDPKMVFEPRRDPFYFWKEGDF